MRLSPLWLLLPALASMSDAGAQVLDPKALCGTRASTVLDALEREDYGAATADFDDALGAALPAEKLAQAWQSLAPRYGRLTARGQAHTSEADHYIAVTIALVFERGTLTAQVACDDSGAIAGFHVVPMPAKAEF
jgi:hypothetical protein